MVTLGAYQPSEKEILQYLYVEEGIGTPTIGKMMGFSHEWIYKLLKKHGIKTRTVQESHKMPFYLEKNRASKLGSKNPMWVEHKTIECENCGKELNISKNSNRRFCCYSCSAEYMKGEKHPNYGWEGMKGKDNPAWTGPSITLNCENCGKTFERRPYEIGLYNNTFCSKECYHEWTKKEGIFRGENHYNWKGGCRKQNYGENWSEHREKTLIRDNYTCQNCGAAQDELNANLQVHHIIPFKEYGLEQYKEANRLDNLVSLCVPCHMSLEPRK